MVAEGGYESLASLIRVGGSAGFNAIFRILIVPVSIVFLSIGLHYLGQSYLINNIWTVAVWYFFIQTFWLTILNRWALVGKMMYLFCHIFSIALSCLIYYSLITQGVEHLLPDETNLRTDLWLIIVAFIYGIFKSIPLNLDKARKKQKMYIYERSDVFRKEFKNELKVYDLFLQNILLSIMIYEDFNRPKSMRIVENIFKTKTRGIMQVVGASDDASSIALTAAALKSAYDKLKVIPPTHHSYYSALHELVSSHNPHDPVYSSEVTDILHIIQSRQP